jgi:hypothetical protein
MANLLNTRGLRTNCGFCAICFALYQKNPVSPKINADNL